MRFAQLLNDLLLAELFFGQGGGYMVTWFDTYAAGISLLCSALFEALAVCWVYGLDRFADDIHQMLGFRPGMYWRCCWKFVSPIFLVVRYVALSVKKHKWKLPIRYHLDQHYHHLIALYKYQPLLDFHFLVWNLKKTIYHIFADRYFVCDLQFGSCRVQRVYISPMDWRFEDTLYFSIKSATLPHSTNKLTIKNKNKKQEDFCWNVRVSITSVFRRNRMGVCIVICGNGSCCRLLETQPSERFPQRGNHVEFISTSNHH